MVGWLGDRAESRARRWLPGGGRGDSGSGEQQARPGLHSGMQAQVVQEEWLGVLGGTGVGRRKGSLGWHLMADGGGLGAHAREERRGFYGWLEAVEVVAWAPS
jgi:hypothetical protein